jgi:polar amino acid transport system substrate-binding protein
MLLTGLEMHRFDVVAAGMFVTPERAARVAFSQPTFHALQALLVRRGNPRGLHSYADAAAAAGVTIAVVAGSVETHLLSDLGMAGERLLQVPDAVTGKSAVATGIADGLALSSPTVRWMAAQDRSGAVEAATPFSQSGATANTRFGFGAFAFRPGDQALRDAWNAAMANVVGSAEHLQAVAPYGFTRDEIHDLPTLEEILAR